MSSTDSGLTHAPRVLVVEDEPMLLQSVVTGLSRLPGVEVVGASSVSAALAEVQVRAPALVISDIDLPDRSGIELLGELGARGLKPHVIFVSAYVKAYRAQIPPHAGVEVMEKPVPLETLRSLVTHRIATPVSTSSPFGVADYLQLASLGHHSVVLDIGGAVTGRICVVEGQAWSATDPLGEGMEAFRRLALAREVLVQCQTLAGEPGPRSLTGSCESLLLECARLQDEAAAKRGPKAAGFTELALDEEPVVPKSPPPPPRIPPVVASPSVAVRPPGSPKPVAAPSAPRPAAPPASAAPLARTAPALSSTSGPPPARPAAAAVKPEAPPAPTFEDLFEQAVEASLSKRHADALVLFKQAAVLRPEDLKVKVNIARLEKLLAAAGAS